MSFTDWAMYGGVVGGGWCAYLGFRRLQLSLAKHPSLRGHARWSQRLARLVPYYELDRDEVFAADDAPEAVVEARKLAFERLARELAARSPRSLAMGRQLAGKVSDVQFVNRYRVPFPFQRVVQESLGLPMVAAATRQRRIADLDGNWSIDLTGAYGVNLLGFDAYKECIDAANERARELGPVLGPYHPVVLDNARRLLAIARQDEVSFHMSGTEAVMQAVRLARYHTKRSHVVRFCGAYHGWWDGVQAGVGNPRPPHEVYTLADVSDASLRVLRTRRDIACVLVNPLQAMHPNGNAPSDSMLLTGERRVGYDKAAYSAWLKRLREVCTERGIALIFDEVFLGFRLAPGGAQEYFGVDADLVTYGKTLGGGLPIGVLCGKARWMRRFRQDAPSDICFARGTFNSHPYVMTAMNEFLRRMDDPKVRSSYVDIDRLWDERAQALNDRLVAADLPVRVANMISIWTVLYTQTGRYHWMFQYYLRRHGIALSWVGSGRMIFSHDFHEVDFAEFCDRFIAAAEAMRTDGWWWSGPGTSRQAIRSRLRREMASAFFGRRRKSPGAPQEAVLPDPVATAHDDTPEFVLPMPEASGAAEGLRPVSHRIE